MDLTATEYGSWTHPDDPGEPSTQARRISVTDRECEILTWLANGCAVLEIGTGLGVSTKALSVGATFISTVDIDPWVHTNVWPTLDNVTTYRSVEAIEQFNFGLIFIDGDHREIAVKRDIAWATEHCLHGGLIVCHDAKMTTVGGALSATFGTDWTMVDTHHGLGLHFC